MSCCCSVAKSCLTLCDPMDCSQQASLSFTVSRVCSNSCLLSQGCHPTIWFSVTTFSSCPQSFPTSGSFPMSWLFPSGGQNIGASTLASVLLMIIQGWFLLGLIDLFVVQGTLKSLLQHHNLKASSFLVLSLLYGLTLISIHDYWKNHSFD